MSTPALVATPYVTCAAPSICHVHIIRVFHLCNTVAVVFTVPVRCLFTVQHDPICRCCDLSVSLCFAFSAMLHVAAFVVTY